MHGLVGPSEIEALIAPLVSDPEDRAFVARCIATEGPTHHRVATFALLKLLTRALALAGASGAPAAAPGEGFAVPMRLPPHLARGSEPDTQYPLAIPHSVIDTLAERGSREAAIIAESLVDGPPHHALANAAMVNLLGALIEHLSKRPAP